MSNPVNITAPEGVPFIEIEREFDAPVEAVFRAHADPELLKRWLGPRGLEMEVVEFDFSTGGRYRYIHRGADGEFAFRGVFHVVRENEFVIQTFEFEAWPDVVSLESMTFERLDGNRTRLKGHSVYPSVEGRDGMVESGMEGGMVEGYQKLDEVLATLSEPANS
jgi:uncharacterized protein YndB with AHSA1/START domain